MVAKDNKGTVPFVVEFLSWMVRFDMGCLQPDLVTNFIVLQWGMSTIVHHFHVRCRLL